MNSRISYSNNIIFNNIEKKYKHKLNYFSQKFKTLEKKRIDEINKLEHRINFLVNWTVHNLDKKDKLIAQLSKNNNILAEENHYLKNIIKEE